MTTTSSPARSTAWPSARPRTVLLAAAVLAGLQAGTYYTWASGVMPGLGRADDRTFVDAMQQINIAIVNPVFMLSFLGAPLLAGAAIVACGPTARPWAIAGAALAVGTVLITGAGNIPLNDALDAAGSVSTHQGPGRRTGRLREHVGRPQHRPHPHLGRRPRLPGVGRHRVP